MSDYDDPKNVVDAEVISDVSGYRQTKYSRTESSWTGSGQGGPRVTYFSMVGPSSPGHQGMPVATIITLGLIFGCLFQWGFLAALGFVFFYIICSAVGIYCNLQTVLRGRVPNPWISRLCAWGVSLMLVSWLV
ncbi:MAG: hypothetical protein Q4F72_08900 [Desulfovibrionaceae bacterium]|nr:hypothetical protein [Desulfovibrionaceae bacterium]